MQSVLASELFSVSSTPRGGTGVAVTNQGEGPRCDAGVCAGALNISSVPGDRPVWPPDDHPFPSAVLRGERPADQVGCSHPSPRGGGHSTRPPGWWAPPRGGRLVWGAPRGCWAGGGCAASGCCGTDAHPFFWGCLCGCRWQEGTALPASDDNTIFLGGDGTGDIVFRVLSQLNPWHSLILIRCGWEGASAPVSGKKGFSGSWVRGDTVARMLFWGAGGYSASGRHWLEISAQRSGGGFAPPNGSPGFNEPGGKRGNRLDGRDTGDVCQPRGLGRGWVSRWLPSPPLSPPHPPAATGRRATTTTGTCGSKCCTRSASCARKPISSSPPSPSKPTWATSSATNTTGSTSSPKPISPLG